MRDQTHQARGLLTRLRLVVQTRQEHVQALLPYLVGKLLAPLDSATAQASMSVEVSRARTMRGFTVVMRFLLARLSHRTSVAARDGTPPARSGVLFETRSEDGGA